MHYKIGDRNPRQYYNNSCMSGECFFVKVPEIKEGGFRFYADWVLNTRDKIFPTNIFLMIPTIVHRRGKNLWGASHEIRNCDRSGSKLFREGILERNNPNMALKTQSTGRLNHCTNVFELCV